MMDKVPMTASGHQAMLDEIKHLKAVERPRIIKAITEARAHGDLSENAEYHAAKDQQGWVEARVAELEDKVSRAEVIDVTKLSGDTVKFGAFVTLVDEDSEEQSVYQIVGEFEADVKKGKISVTSPIARAIIGKKKGDSVEVDDAGRRQELRDRQDPVQIALLLCRFSRHNRESKQRFVVIIMQPFFENPDRPLALTDS